MSKRERINKQAERFAKDKITKGMSDSKRERAVRESVSKATDVINLGDKLKGILIALFIIVLVIGGAIIGLKYLAKSICPHWIYDPASVRYTYKYRQVSFKCEMCREYVGIDCGKDDIKVTVIEDSTCSVEGVQEEVWTVPGKPSLNATVIGVVATKLHDYVESPSMPSREPTCTALGYTGTVVCTMCGLAVEGESIPKTDHDPYRTGVISATCTSDGASGAKRCRDCDKLLEESTVIPRLEHNFVESVIEPTYTTSGYISYPCSRCEAHDTEREETIPCGFAHKASCVAIPAADPTYVQIGGIAEGVTELEIPDSIDGLPVKVIAPKVGGNNTSLRRLVIPATVDTIKPEAFCAYRGLEEIIILSGSVEIGNEAFRSCTALRRVEIRGAASLPYRAFDGCTALEEIKLGDSFTSIGRYAFRDCVSLTVFKIPTSVTEVHQEAFIGCKSLVEIYDTYGRFSSAYPPSVISVQSSPDASTRVFVEDGCTYITDSSGNYYMLRYGKSGDDVILPESVRGHSYTITVGALRDKTDITSLVMNTVSQAQLGYLFGESAGTSSAQKNVPVSLTEITVNTESAIPTGYLSSLTNLKRVTLTAKTKNYENFLGGASALEELTLPIKQDAFFGKIFGASMIANQKNSVPQTLAKVTVLDTAEIPWSYFEGITSLTDVTLPDTVNVIADRAFFGCTGLKKFVIPQAVTQIRSQAFGDCVNLIEVYNLSSLDIVAGEKSVNGRVGEYAKAVYRSLDESSAIVDVGDFQFLSFGSVVAYLVNYSGTSDSITLPSAPNGAKYVITEDVFKSNTLLKHITIPSSVSEIEAGAFSGCTNLETVTFEGDITSLPDSLF